MRATRWTAVVFTTLLGGALTALPGSQATAATAPTSPAVGECRQLTPRQIEAPTNTTAPISCSTRHDARVIAVPTLPAGVRWSDLPTTRKRYAMAVSMCYSAYRKALGQVDTVRDQTAYTFVFFEPTKPQRASGARWLRCDLVLQHGTGFATLPTDQEPALTDATPPDTVARCLHQLRSRFWTTTCQGNHQYRATGTFVLRKPFPGRPALLHAARSQCPSRVSTDTNFRFTWSPEPVWNLARDRVVVCYSHTTG